MSYQELSLEERITIQIGQLQGLSQRAIARMLNRSPRPSARSFAVMLPLQRPIRPTKPTKRCASAVRSAFRPVSSIHENINGLIRQYLPKGTDLSGVSQEQLEAIAYELNIRPRQSFDYQCPIEMMTQMMAKHHESSSSTQ